MIDPFPMTQSTSRNRIVGLMGTLGFSALSVFAIAVAPANAQNNASTYPPTFTTAFLQACKNGATANAERLELTDAQLDQYCNCSLTEIQNSYTFDELQEQLGSIDLFSITCNCAKASGIASIVAQCGQ